MEKARTKAIQAVVAEPYNPITWRALDYWAKGNHLQLRRVHIEVPNSVDQKDEKNITITVDPKLSSEVSGVWLAYSLVRVRWRREQFKQQFPEEKAYRHSLAEEAEALTTAAKVWNELRSSKKGSAMATDPNISALLTLYQAKLIEPYVLLNAADGGIAQDYAAYREKNRNKLEEYLGTFIAPPLQTSTAPREASRQVAHQSSPIKLPIFLSGIARILLACSDTSVPLPLTH